MAFQKTKLYYDLSRLIPAAKEAAAPPFEASKSMACTRVDHDAEARAKAGEGTAAPDAQRGSRILRIADFLPERLQTVRQSPALAQTRVQPIEHLLAAPRDEDVQDDEDLRATTAMTRRPPPLSGSGTRKLELRRDPPGSTRRRLLVATGLVALLAIVVGSLVALGHSGVRPTREGEASTPTPDDSALAPVRAEAPAAPDAPPSADPQADGRPQVAARSVASAESIQPSMRARPKVRRGKGGPVAPADDPLERKAVDALAGGDYAGALRSYEGLAQQHPERHVYAEVARILRQRIERTKQR